MKGDIRDGRLVDALLDNYNVDSIVNFAAETHVDRSLVQSSTFLSTDVLGTHVLLNAARNKGVKTFLQVSTDEVYGSANKDRSFSERDVLNPSSPYSASKAAADLVALSFHKSYGMDVRITRSSNNYGPFQYPEKLIPKAITRALKGQQIPVYGKGLQRRNWICVTDNCEAIFAVLDRGKAGEIYNIASEDELRNIDVIRAVLDGLSLPESVISLVEDRPGHDFRYAINASKIRKLGWRPRHSFRKALPEVIQWYAKNSWWWEPLLTDRFVNADITWK